MGKLLVKKITLEEVLNDEKKDYNPALWDEAVMRYMKYFNVEFYKAEKDSLNQYTRIFVVYTMPEGIRLMKELEYMSCLDCMGFVMALFSEYDFDPETNEIKKFNPGYCQIETLRIMGPDGPFVLNNSKEAVKWMTERSVKYNTVYTKIEL